MSRAIRLDNAASMHPIIHLSFPESFLGGQSSEECEPAVLLRLPPALYLDPNTFPHRQIKGFRYLNSTYPPLDTFDFNKVELELGVGYSLPSTQRTTEGRPEDRTQPVRPRQDNVKRVGENRYRVASAGDGRDKVRYRDVYTDTHHPFAKEYRAVLFQLQTGDSESTAKAKAAVRYNYLTGRREGEVAVGKAGFLDIPLHSRYVSPQAIDFGTDIWKALLFPSAGNFERVSLDKPEMFWMCRGTDHPIDTYDFDKISPSDLLPSPHSHLSFQLTFDESLYHFWRYKMPSQDTPFLLRLPAGNATLGPYIHIVTFAFLIVAAMWAAVQVRTALLRIQKTQARVGKRQSLKSQ
ncbi:hypothetical protein CBS101457_004729 [Exobasidium rhododendri]|nr:hypothetical protein CBS101457_004729 [Exobasidium rhododendri]